MVYLEKLFEEFCKYLDGKLRWGPTKGKKWTEAVLSFLSEQNKKEPIPCIEILEHMRVDYIWRYGPSMSIHDIELAVEHECETRKIDELVNEEIQHLVDLKARNKIGVFYPARGDEGELMKKITERIKAQTDYVKLPSEKYLIILGYATTKDGKRAILLKGFFLDSNGKITDERERVVLQAEREHS